MTISESIIKVAHEGIEAQPLVSDVEKAARAIVARMGQNPDTMAFHGPALMFHKGICIVPFVEQQRPLWMFFTQEAEAALNAVQK